MKHFQAGFLLALFAVVVFSCGKDEPEEPIDVPDVVDTSVHVILDQMPFAKLSDYRFFTGDMKLFQPNSRVLPYEPITPLFSDYAHKSRFIWMPENVSATYQDDHHILNFPDGTVLIKSFYYDHVQPDDTRRILETRLIYRKNGEWFFADYLWNEEQTEATFSLDGDYVPVDFIDDNGNARYVNFRIPSEVECHTCHKSNLAPIPIGPKPQNLNKSFTYADGVKNQLEKWQEVGYLSGDIPESISTTVSWSDISEPLELRVRSYLDANCSYCHSDDGHCYYRPMRLAYNMTENSDNLGVCVAPQEFITPQLTHVIARGNTNRSVMYYRMNTVDSQYRMPLFGRTIIHDEGLALIGEYIDSLEPSCN